jgi:hypothetical protein
VEIKFLYDLNIVIIALPAIYGRGWGEIDVEQTFNQSRNLPL